MFLDYNEIYIFYYHRHILYNFLGFFKECNKFHDFVIFHFSFFCDLHVAEISNIPPKNSNELLNTKNIYKLNCVFTILKKMYMIIFR